MQFDALDRVLSKIDVMGAPPLSPRERRVSAATAWRSGAVGASAPAAAPAPAAALAEAVGATIQRASSFGRRPKAPNHKQQLKHALTVNAAHVITQDYVMLSRPLTDGLMLMDAQERKLRMVRSLGELLPLRRYTTEYGNTLERVSKHKAVLAGTIELPIATDEVGFDEHLARLANTHRHRVTLCASEYMGFVEDRLTAIRRRADNCPCAVWQPAPSVAGRQRWGIRAGRERRLAIRSRRAHKAIIIIAAEGRIQPVRHSTRYL